MPHPVVVVTPNFFTVREEAQDGDEEGNAERKRARLPGILPPGRISPKVRHPEVSGMGGAVEQVTGDVVTRATRGTGRVVVVA